MKMKMKSGILNLALLFAMLMTIDVGYGQNYPAATQTKYPMNLYSEADTKGVLVIGSGAPVFTPKSKQSRVYIDSVAGNLYCRKNGSWRLIAGVGVDTLTASSVMLEGTTQVKLDGGRLIVDIPSQADAPEGAFLYNTAGDSLVYSVYGISTGVPTNSTVLVYDSGRTQFVPSGIITGLVSGTRYANDAAAGVGGISVGWYYPVASTNDYSLPTGTLKQRQ